MNVKQKCEPPRSMRLLWRCIGTVSAYFLMSAATAATPMTKNATITLPTDKPGPYFHLTLPQGIYQGSVDSQLSDLRIKNAKGEFLHYAWRSEQDMHDAPAATTLRSIKVPIFPITGKADFGNFADNEVLTQVSKNKDGSVHLKLQVTTPPTQENANHIQTWIIDASKIAASSTAATQLLQLRLNIPKDYQGLALFELQTSKDLQHWHSIESQGQIARLRHQGELIEQLTIPLNMILTPSSAPYLRLRWYQPTSAPRLTSVLIDTLVQHATPAPLQWSAAINPQHCEALFCDYTVPRNTPIDSLRFELQAPNTLAKVHIIGQRAPDQNARPAHRHTRNPLYHLRHKNQPAATSKAAEYLLAETTLYRLHQGETLLKSSDIALDGASYTSIRLQVAKGIKTLGDTPPKLNIAHLARTLTFLASGDAPYSLTWGVPNKEGAAITLAELIPNAQLSEDQIAWAEAHIKPPAPAAPIIKSAPESASNSNKLWLWLALGTALILLAAMVVSLLRGIDRNK